MDPTSTSMVKEGLVVVDGMAKDGGPMFYNFPQVFNRDLSIIVLKAFIELQQEKHEEIVKSTGRPLGNFIGLNILEMLAATGIRSIRYIKELGEELVNHVYINDLDRSSAESIPTNAKINGIDAKKYRALCADGIFLANLLTPPVDVLRLMLMPRGFQRIPCGFAPIESPPFMDQHNAKVNAFLDLIAVSPSTPDHSIYRNIIDVIDVDPYSSASGFIDAAVKCVRNGGMLFVTSTDMPTLCGNNPSVSFYRYGGSSIKAPFCHEMSLRVILYSIATSASRYKRIIEPLISCSVDFYVRVFVRVVYSPESCKKLASNSGLVLMCCVCDSFKFIKLGEYSESKQRPASLPSDLKGKCEECGGRIKIGGPLYLGKIHDHSFVDKCIEIATNAPKNLVGISTNAKIVGLLTSIKEVFYLPKSSFGSYCYTQELDDAPLYYQIPKLCKKWNLSMIRPVAFKSALEKLGYRASHFHRDPLSLKTDATAKVVMDIMRHHANAQKKKCSHCFLEKEIETEGIDLTPPAKINKTSVPRWLSNPTSHWGPKKMHKQVASSLI